MEEAENREHFFPKGALAFFVAMLAFYGLIWAALYGVMVARR